MVPNIALMCELSTLLLIKANQNMLNFYCALNTDEYTQKS